jgi:hypothetical protein
MAIKFNPYDAQYSSNYVSVLDAVATAMNPSEPDVDTLTDTIVGAVNTDYFSSGLNAAQLAEFKTLPIFALNAYQNGEIANLTAYNMIQRDFINLLTQSIFNIPIDTIPARLLDVQDNVMKSGLSSSEQGPILFSVMVGVHSFNYWKDKVETPGDWADFLNETAPYQASQYALIPYWVAAAMEGSLYGANVAVADGTDSYADNPGISKWVITALVTSLAVNTGKVIFGVIPRIQNNCGL